MPFEPHIGLRSVSSEKLYHDQTLMSISELSARSKCNRATIRFYVKLGILPPPLKARGNLNLFNSSHLNRLMAVKHLKESDNLTLEQIKGMLDKDEWELRGESALSEALLQEHGKSSKIPATIDLQHEKKMQIIDHAVTQFAKLGYESVKISDISDHFQMGKGTFYLYFNNKKDLFFASFERLGSMIAGLESRDDVRNEKDFIKRLAKRWVAFTENFFCMFSILTLLRSALFSDEREMKERAWNAYNAITAPLVKELEREMDLGHIKRTDAQLLAHALHGLSEGLTIGVTHHPDYQIENIADMLHSLLKSVLGVKEENESVLGANCDDEVPPVALTDRNGVSTYLKNIRFDGAPYLIGRLGGSKIRVYLSKLAAITFNFMHSKCIALLAAMDEKEVSVEIDGATLITGDTSFGSLDIPIESVSHITVYS